MSSPPTSTSAVHASAMPNPVAPAFVAGRHVRGSFGWGPRHEWHGPWDGIENGQRTAGGGNEQRQTHHRLIEEGAQRPGADRAQTQRQGDAVERHETETRGAEQRRDRRRDLHSARDTRACRRVRPVRRALEAGDFDRLGEPFEDDAFDNRIRELARDRAIRLTVDEDAAGGYPCNEAGGAIDHVTDGTVVRDLLGAHATDAGMANGDTDGQVHRMTEPLAQFIHRTFQLYARIDGQLGKVGALQRAH